MIYLDNAATSFPKPESVYTAMDTFQRTLGGNPGRSGHRLATGAQAVLERTRRALARLLGAPDPSRVVFTLNATDALNIAIKGVLRPGDHVVTSAMEHNSVARPLAALERAGTIQVDRAANDAGGRIDVDSLCAKLRPGTRLVAVSWASNAFGTLQPVAEIAAAARANHTLVLLDAAQVAGSLPIDVGALSVDLLALPGHKGLLGPTGTGALWVKDGLDLAPWREGGTGGDSSDPLQPRQMPHRLEAGTHNIAGIAGLERGLEWLGARTVAEVRRHEMALCDELWTGLAAVPGVARYGPAAASARAALVSFRLDGYLPQEAAAILDTTFDIAVRAGLHCAPGSHRALGTAPDGTIRASVGPFSTAADIQALLSALKQMAAERPA
ncbi:MAG: aminotransferase class V-fold PLP-dependent enzyme [Deltaproteobacteria bacterium]|nr:aminotransferase class V-fold PLP-dependent enzyme [Deltaproteobacteria bacterium]